MNQHTLVMDYNPELIGQFRHTRMAVNLASAAEIPAAAEMVSRHNTLAALIVPIDSLAVLEIQSLAVLEIQPQWRDIPLAFHLRVMNPFRELADRIELLKGLNARYFFDAGQSGNYTGCRILSSLGLAAGLFFTTSEPDWEAMCDLLAYSMYGKSPHTPVEPFHHLVTTYKPDARNSWAAVWFDDPATSLHISAEGIAATRRDLADGRFLSHDLSEVERIDDNTLYQEHLEGWRRFFLEEDVCACCPAWRVCLGSFQGVCADPEQGCRKFFQELLDCADQYRQVQQDRRQLWQP